MPEVSATKRWFGIGLFVAVALSSVATTWLTLARLDGLPRTDDASVSAEFAHVSPGVPGRIAVLAVEENQKVAAGDLILKLDNTAYGLQRDQADAQVAAARAAIKDADRMAGATTQNAASARAEIDRAQTNLDLVRATVARLEPLAADGIASQQSLDEARTAASDAEVSLRVAQQSASAASDLISNSDTLQAELRAAQSVLALAEHTLSLTEVYAPFDGYVTGLNAREGSWVLPEQPVLSLIDSNSWHVEAFFRETDLADIAPGAAVRVRVLAQNDVALSGVVTSIGRGVLGTDEIALDGQLPFVMQTTDWVRLAKRFPVRIALDDADADFLRLGGSATVTLLPDGSK